MRAHELPRMLRARRKQLGLTQTQVAERMNTSHTYVSDLEMGKHQPSLDTLVGWFRAVQLEPRFEYDLLPAPAGQGGDS